MPKSNLAFADTLETAHTAVSPTNPVQDFYRSLKTWDLSTIKRYMVQKGIYPAVSIDRAEDEYKRWLALALAYRGQSVPISAALDPFWHTHIIFTENYSQMGHAVVGRYIHHRPSILDDEHELKRAFSIKTLILYREHFGSPDMHFWDSVLCKCGPTD